MGERGAARRVFSAVACKLWRAEEHPLRCLAGSRTSRTPRRSRRSRLQCPRCPIAALITCGGRHPPPTLAGPPALRRPTLPSPAPPLPPFRPARRPLPSPALARGLPLRRLQAWTRPRCWVRPLRNRSCHLGKDRPAPRTPDTPPACAPAAAGIVKKHGASITVAAKDWVDRYREGRAAATAELLTFLLQVRCNAAGGVGGSFSCCCVCRAPLPTAQRLCICSEMPLFSW